MRVTLLISLWCSLINSVCSNISKFSEDFNGEFNDDFNREVERVWIGVNLDGVDKDDVDSLVDSGPNAESNPESPKPQTTPIEDLSCDFSTPCLWRNIPSPLTFRITTGSTTNLIGGPPQDTTTNSNEGGYTFIETSQQPSSAKNIYKTTGGLLESPTLDGTGPNGNCLSFKFNINGLSVGGLRISILAIDYSVDNEFNVTICDGRTVATVWQGPYYFWGIWKEAQVLYTYAGLHKVVFEGVPVDGTDPGRAYRGYIAIDDIELQAGPLCIGFCNFAGGFCDWNNDPEDDFDWTISRGTTDPTTGPPTDRSALNGYAYIDSRFPRHPGDKAVLLSAVIPPTNGDSPICFRFYFHMHGPAVGSLKIYIKTLDNEFHEIWGLSGNFGNMWIPGQVTIANDREFNIAIEGTVGNTGGGDIGLDEIGFESGSCPVSPIHAAPVPRDCSFETDECDWSLVRSPDQPEWQRVSSQSLSPRNQRRAYTNTQPTNRRNDYFLGLARLRGGSRDSGGGTARLVSREMEGPVCVTFWYCLVEPFVEAGGPSLGEKGRFKIILKPDSQGKVAVTQCDILMKLKPNCPQQDTSVLRISFQRLGSPTPIPTPVWELYNNQGPNWNYAQAPIDSSGAVEIIFEGTWGPNRANGVIGIDDITIYGGNCSVHPPSALTTAATCSFDGSLCGWQNHTVPNRNHTAAWQLAYPTHRPAQLLDKTFGSTGDFVFFDIFTISEKFTHVELISPIIDAVAGARICLSFWFAAFGVEEGTMLDVIVVEKEEGEDDQEKTEKLWSLTAKGFNNPRPLWTPAQVTINPQGPFQIILKGTASNGGFAIDDIKFQPLNCPTRPPAATVIDNESN